MRMLSYACTAFALQTGASSQPIMSILKTRNVRIVKVRGLPLATLISKTQLSFLSRLIKGSKGYLVDALIGAWQVRRSSLVGTGS